MPSPQLSAPKRSGKTRVGLGVLLAVCSSLLSAMETTENPTDPNLHFVTTSEARVAYRVDGQGPGLVLVPGTGGNSESNWAHLVSAFSADWKVVRPEYSGAGHTHDDGTPLTVEKVAAQVVAAARDAGASPFDLVGYSLGASIAAYIAAEYPQDVNSVVLLAGFASGDNSRARLQFQLWKDLIQHDLQSMARLVILNGFSPDYVASMNDAQIAELTDIIVAINDWPGMLRQIDLDLSLDIQKQLPQIQKPVLVIGCTHDQLVPVEQVKAFAAAISGSEYLELNSGHLAFVEKADEFAQMTREFLFKQRNTEESKKAIDSQ